MQWKPWQPWSATFSFFGPSVNAEIACGDPRKIQAFMGFNWNPQSFLREDREFKQDRLFYDEKKTQAGVRFPIVSTLASEFSGGYAFARSVYEGQRFGKRYRGSAALGDSWFAAWGLHLEF